MRKMTKAQFGLHIWIGIFLCLFSVSCSDDDTDSIKGDDDDTDLSINHWIEKKLVTIIYGIMSYQQLTK